MIIEGIIIVSTLAYAAYIRDSNKKCSKELEEETVKNWELRKKIIDLKLEIEDLKLEIEKWKFTKEY